jgi:molybdenum-dependent DNA-binding transcriptional regulator ModE
VTSLGEELLDQIDEARERLYASVRARAPETLAQRPTPEAWSVVENVRHLLFAEQKHLGRLYAEGFAYSPIGLRMDGRQRSSGAGSQPTDDVEEVLAAWDVVHEEVREAVERADDAERALDRNLRHLRSHVRTIEKLLDEGGVES